MSLYTESLLEREPNLSERARGYLTTIQRAIEDVARTVARMREFYREREAQLTLERVDVNRAVRQVVELTQPRWSDLPQQRGVMVELKTELAEALPDIMGAEHEIRDALTNLIFNAVDAMPAGGTLTVRTRKVTDGGGADRVVIEVGDTGIGMDEDTRRRCLEPFYTTKGERGTGLGLAMVYGMIQRHSAEIEIESAAGPGHHGAPGLSGRYASRCRTSRQTRPAVVVRRRLRILLVDDDPMLIKSLQDTLQEDGHVITATHGGQAGIDAFAAAHAARRALRRRHHRPRHAVRGRPQGCRRDQGTLRRDARHSAHRLGPAAHCRRTICRAHVDKVLSKPPRLHELRAALAELHAHERHRNRSAGCSSWTTKWRRCAPCATRWAWKDTPPRGFSSARQALADAAAPASSIYCSPI